MMRSLSRFLLVAGIALIASVAQAQPVQAPVTISAAVAKTCTFTAFDTVIDLGTYDPASAINVSFPNFYTISCTRGTRYTLEFDRTGGNMPNTSGGPVGSTDTLAYTLTEVGNLTALPTTTPGATSPYYGVSNARTDVVNMGFDIHVASGQDIDYGTYSQTVMATFNY